MYGVVFGYELSGELGGELGGELSGELSGDFMVNSVVNQESMLNAVTTLQGVGSSQLQRLVGRMWSRQGVAMCMRADSDVPDFTRLVG